MISTVAKLLELLNQQERRRGYLLLCMIVIMALLEVVGVASVMPFMSVLSNPGIIEQNTMLKWLYESLSFKGTTEFLRFLGLVVFVALVTSISFKALTTYALLRFTNMRNYSLSRRLVAAYLCQPYDWFLNHHSADLGKTILTEVQQVVYGTIIPFMLLIAHGAVALSLLLLLIIVDPILAFSVTTGLGLAYAVIYFSLRGYLGRIGKERVKANRTRFQVVQETFGGIKDVKVSGMEAAMLSRYEVPAKCYARHEAASQIAAQLPRFAMEIIAFGGMLLVVLYLMSREGGFESALPIIVLYGFAGFRLLPALQAVYQQFSHLRFSAAAFDNLHQDMKVFMQTNYNLPARDNEHNQSLSLTSSLELENISYTYQGAERQVLSQLSLSIPANTTVAFVGSTGSGKTTTVDICLLYTSDAADDLA